ncbi:hypothetical protein GY45DRAFT_451478 [Cubamyces sp. BRFM 1775]|nr:hypothetical protein GY45DRAFT_451478 [Cubamyces sp. BRFM 1775]
MRLLVSPSVHGAADNWMCILIRGRRPLKDRLLACLLAFFLFSPLSFLFHRPRTIDVDHDHPCAFQPCPFTLSAPGFLLSARCAPVYMCVIAVPIQLCPIAKSCAPPLGTLDVLGVRSRCSRTSAASPSRKFSSARSPPCPSVKFEPSKMFGPVCDGRTDFLTVRCAAGGDGRGGSRVGEFLTN